MTDTTAAVAEAALPPYSGEHTTCAKCRNIGAVTRYRPAAHWRVMTELNGRRRPGPQPERLERECHRCDYQWDEALPADDRADGGLTVDQLAHALDNCTPYRIELHPEIARFMAERLAEMCAVYPVPGHPVWQPEEEPPPAVAPQDPEGPKGPKLTPEQRAGAEAIIAEQQQETDR
ncbi:hypothetical protein [Streptomyces collinus]